MRAWLQKQKKKDDAKAAAQATTPTVEATPAPSDVLLVDHVKEQTTENADQAPQSEETSTVPAADQLESHPQQAGSEASQPHEVNPPSCALPTNPQRG